MRSPFAPPYFFTSQSITSCRRVASMSRSKSGAFARCGSTNRSNSSPNLTGSMGVMPSTAATSDAQPEPRAHTKMPFVRQ